MPQCLLYFIVVLLMIFILPTQVLASVTLLSPEGVDPANKTYMQKILTGALKATATEGEEVEVKEVVINAGYHTRTYLLNHHDVDVAYFPASQKYEQQLIPIRVPLYKNLIGYRTLVIKADQQAKFNTIKSFEALKELINGSRDTWITTKVFAHHHFNYVPVTSMNNIYKMLAAGKVDYSTRGVIEAEHDLQILKNEFPSLKIEDTLLFYFELPVYFFVAKGNQELANRITDGLMIMIENGTFDKLFQQIFNTIPVDLNLHNRTVIALENPFQSSRTRHNARTFWQNKIKRPAF